MPPGTAKTHPTLLVEDPRRLAALASPLRQEIIDAAEAAGPCSIADLARWIGRPADRLYFHIRRLLRVGLLIEAGQRREGRHVATLYALPARHLRLAYRPERPANLRALTSITDGALRLASRDFRRTLATGRAVVEGPDRDTWGGRLKGWITPAEQRRINALMLDIQRILRRARPRPGTRCAAFTFVLTPSRHAAEPKGRKP